MRRRAHVSECRPTRNYVRPIPKQTVIQFANASLARRRSSSVAASQSPLGNLGSALFASTLSKGIAGAGLSGGPSIDALADTAPVIVELPHESITVEDYARPMYRKDIFFP